MNLSSLHKVSPCILSFNRREDVRFTLNKLLSHGDIWADIFVADNDSNDGTRDMVAQCFPNVKVINTGGNHGIHGWNFAFEQVKSEWILSLDDDSHPVLETWSSVCDFLASDPEAVALSLSMQGRESILSKNQKDHFQPTWSFSSAGVLLKKNIVDSLGGYDQDLFLFTNEIDWSARAAINGYYLLKSDAAHVVHRSTPLQRASWRHAYYYCRNLLIWILRYVPRQQVPQILNRYIRDICFFTLLHRTRYYLKAFSEGKRIFMQRPVTPCLTADQLQQFAIDWRMPFWFLG